MHLNEEENRFAARVEDALQLVEDKSLPRYIGFLDERQQGIARTVIRGSGYERISFFGGYEGAERAYLGVFPYYMDCGEEAFPIDALTLTFRKQDSISHRDILGALMALRVKRETIGDILVGEGQAAVFVARPVSPVILDSITKIGRIGVNIQKGLVGALPIERRFETIEGTVASLRLDCILALITRLSREAVDKLILSGRVSVNFEEAGSRAQCLQCGDKLSVRGYGRFELDSVGQPTRKGRLHITAKKYV